MGEMDMSKVVAVAKAEQKQTQDVVAFLMQSIK